MIEYYPAPDIKQKIDKIIELLRFEHIDPEKIHCIRSRGSTAAYTIARVHGLGRIWQTALSVHAMYVIEVISEKYDAQSPQDQTRTLVHELLHIPERFQGGFRHHKNHVTRENVEKWCRRLTQKLDETGGKL